MVKNKFGWETLQKVCFYFNFLKVDYFIGITLLRMACNIGTSDPRFMSAIYSQLGSVYYAQKKYEKAKKYYSDHLLLAQ